MRSIDWMIALGQILCSLVAATLASFASMRAFAAATRGVDEAAEMRRGNVSVGIVIASVILATGLIVRAAVEPAMSSLELLLHTGIDAGTLARWLAWTSSSLVAAVLLSFIAVATAARSFLALTCDVDEVAEIRKDNCAIALPLGAVIIVTGIFVALGAANVFHALVPFPDAAIIHLPGRVR